MKIYPAIDLYNSNAVRLFKGDYAQMTIYEKDPVALAQRFQSQGTSHLHLVDLEGAQKGSTSNLEVIKGIVENTNLFIQLGGGIRSMETAQMYIDLGINRIVLGTAAITHRDFLQEALREYGEKIAVGVDIKDETVAIKGWTELSDFSCLEFCTEMQDLGVKTIICTDISKDGAMNGTNLELYKTLSQRFSLDIIASGGVSSLEDVHRLSEMNLHGAILGKALYTGNISLSAALDATKE